MQASLPPSSFLYQWGLSGSCRLKCVESLLHKNVLQVGACLRRVRGYTSLHDL